MGWFGYDLYGGDETFTTQLFLLEKAGIPKKDIYEDGEPIYCPACGHEGERETNAYNDMTTIQLTKEHKKMVVKAYPKLVKYLKDKPPKRTSAIYMEDWAIGWQMFADLIMNNDLPMTKQIKKIATIANNWLASEAHCGDFNNPKKRRNVIEDFGDQLKLYNKVKHKQSKKKGKAMKELSKQYLEYSDGNSNKFWEILYQGTSFTTNWGRIGATPQSSTKSFSNNEECKKEYDKLITAKIKKGYKYC